MDVVKNLELGVEKKKELLDYLLTEIDREDRNSAEREAKFAKLIKNYRCTPETGKNFPFEGCANFRTPLSAIACDAIIARLSNLLLGADPFLSVSSTLKNIKELDELADDIEVWLQQYHLSSSSNWFDKVSLIISTAVKYGSVDGLVEYERSSRTVKMWDEYNKVVKSKNVTLVDGPVVNIPNPWDTFSARKDTIEVEKQPWLGLRYYLSRYDVEQAVKSGFFLEEAKKSVPGRRDRIASEPDQTKSELEGVSSSEEAASIEFREIHHRFDISTNQNEVQYEDAITTISMETRTIVRCIHNPFFHGQRPWLHGFYMNDDNRWEGYGVLEKLESVQDEVDTIHRQALDANTLSVNIFFTTPGNIIRDKAGKGHLSVKPNSIEYVHSPEKIQTEQLGNMSQVQHSIALEQIVRGYGEKLSGVNDYSTNSDALLKSRATFGGTQAILNEGNQRFVSGANNIRRMLSRLGLQELQLWQQYDPTRIGRDLMKINVVNGENGMELVPMSLPSGIYFPDRMKINMAASNNAINKSVEREILIGLADRMVPMWNQVIQLVGIVESQQMPDSVKMLIPKIVQAYYYLYSKLIKSFEEVPDVDKLLPNPWPDRGAQPGGTVPAQGGGQGPLESISEIALS